MSLDTTKFQFLSSTGFFFLGDHDMKVTAKGSQMATKCANLTEHMWDLGEECLTAGGCVSSMEWDPLGGRLAVIFQGNSCAPTNFQSCSIKHYVVLIQPNIRNILSCQISMSLWLCCCLFVFISFHLSVVVVVVCFSFQFICQLLLYLWIAVNIKQNEIGIASSIIVKSNDVFPLFVCLFVCCCYCCCCCFRSGKPCPRVSCSIQNPT